MTDFKEMIRKANERYEAMSPQERAAMWQAQRESWVRAFTNPCEHGDLDWESCPHCRAAHEEGKTGSCGQTVDKPS